MASVDRMPIIGRVKLRVTDYGRTHPLMKLTPDADANVKQWSDLPPLNDYNKTLDAKVGGIVLARGEAEQRGGAIRFFSLISATAAAARWLLRRAARGDGRCRWIIEDQTYELVLEADTALAGEHVARSGDDHLG